MSELNMGLPKSIKAIHELTYKYVVNQNISIESAWEYSRQCKNQLDVLKKDYLSSSDKTYLKLSSMVVMGTYNIVKNYIITMQTSINIANHDVSFIKASLDRLIDLDTEYLT